MSEDSRSQVPGGEKEKQQRSEKTAMIAMHYLTMQRPPLLAAAIVLLLSCAADAAAVAMAPAAIATAPAAVATAPAAGPFTDAAALLAFKAKADTGNRLASFNASANHCLWPGVSCSAAGRVVRLVLEGASLTGFLAGGSLDRLDQLRLLSLKSNSLAGPIPDLSSLRNLKALFLADNRLGGPFPASLLSLSHLSTLDLSHNHLAGSIPPAIADLDRLYALRLDSNRFAGPLPALNQSTLKIFNVSHNNFSGAIPATVALSAFGASAFTANPLLCGETVGRACAAHFIFFPHAEPSPPAAIAGHRGAIRPPSSPPGWIHKKSVVAAAFLVAALLLIGLLFVALAMRRRRMDEKGEASAGQSAAVEIHKEEFRSGNSELMAAAAAALSEEKVRKLAKSGCLVFCAGETQIYTLEQLMKSSAEMLGKGRLGSTYKAVLEGGLIVTVKRLDADRLAPAGKEAFERHMEAVGRLRHPNLVPLRAYFQAKEERLLVYDYQHNGSLHSLIHGSRSTRPKALHWTSCLKIAEDVAQGLAYIHQASGLVHGSIKSSNILLGSEFEACLTDNCLSFLVDPSDGEVELGHQDPETRRSNGPLTPSSDVYSFGTLLLELLTGKPPSQQPVLAATDLPAWVRAMREDGADEERLLMIIDIAAACVHGLPDSRPPAWQVLKMIQEVKEAGAGDNDSDPPSLS